MTSLSRPRVEFISTILQTVLNLGLLCLGLILVVFLGKETVHLADVLFAPEQTSKYELVEGLVGYIRRNVCVPIPKVDTIEELNRMFREKCQQYLSHQIRGKESSVGKMLMQERDKLYPLPRYPFDPCKRATGRVDRFCTVRFDTNNYSVPAAYCGKEVSVRASPETVSFYFGGQCISRHRRCLERKQSIYNLEHYLPLM